MSVYTHTHRFGKGLGLVGDILGEDHWLNQKNVVYGLFIYTGVVQQ